MNKLLIGAATVASIAAFPIASFAATYQYVNTSGMLETETAANPTLALTQPLDIAPHSGVILVPDTDVSPITVTTTTTGAVTPIPATTVTISSSNGPTETSVIWPGQQFGMTNASTTMVAGTYTGAAPANFSNGTVFYLNLAPNSTSSSVNSGNAMLTTTSTGSNPVVETGTWTLLGNGQVQVNLTSNGTTNLVTPQTITFNLNGQTLSASQYDSSVYGTSGFMLTK